MGHEVNRKPTLNAKVVRGLRTIEASAWADLEVADWEADNGGPDDRAERAESHAAIRYIRALVKWHDAKRTKADTRA